MSAAATTGGDALHAMRVRLDAAERALCQHHPQRLTALGLDEGLTQWDGVDDAARGQRDVALAQALSLDAPAGDVRAALWQQAWRTVVSQRKDANRWFLHAYPINPMLGVPNQTGGGLRVPFFLCNVQPLRGRADALAFVERLRASGAHLKALARELERGAAEGIALPQPCLAATRQAVLDQLRGCPIDATGEPHPILARLCQAAAGRPDLSEAQLDVLVDQASRALRDEFAPGMHALLRALDTMALHAPAQPGVWQLPEGEAFYAHALERWAGTSERAAQVHARAHADVLALRERAAALLGALGFGNGRAQGFAAALDAAAASPSWTFPDSAQGREDYLARCRRLSALAEGRLPSFVGPAPALRLEIRAVEPYRQRSASFGEFYPPAADGSRPSLYYVNLVDMARVPRSELAALTFHEGVPGHHVQIAGALTNESLPQFLREPFAQEATAEGWAMYAEALGLEMLPDEVDDLDRLGQVTRALFMAARVVVDTGLHALRWPREQAVRYLCEHTAVAPAQIEFEVDRYAVWPGQACAYHEGARAFHELRDQGEREGLGLPQLHGAVLAAGALPPALLGQALAAARAGAE